MFQPERGYMGKRDIYTSPFIANKKRFAELVNVNIYGGKEIVKAEKLKRLGGRYPALSNPSGEKMRDILMEQESPRMRYGIEVETEIDYGMPERIMLYDAGEYEEQIREMDRKHRTDKSYDRYVEKKSRMKEKDRFVPVITIVLYLGEGKWSAPYKLTEMLEIPKEVESCSNDFLQDYKIHVVEADAVNPQDYRTDLREFFLALQCRNDRKRLNELFESEDFQHLSHETELAIAVNLNLKTIIVKMEEEGIPMCRAFEELMTEQEEIGMEKGIKEGIKESIKALVETCKEFGASKEETENRIVMKLSLLPSDARNYVNLYWR